MGQIESLKGDKYLTQAGKVVELLQSSMICRYNIMSTAMTKLFYEDLDSSIQIISVNKHL